MLSTRWRRLTGTSLSILALTWFVWLLSQYPEIFASMDARAITAMVLIAFLYSLTILISGLAWWILLSHTTSTNTSLSLAVSILCLSQVGKYLPGNIAHHAGRAVLARRHGIGMDAILFTMFMEIVWVFAVASLLALASLWFLGSRLSGLTTSIPQWWVLLCIALLSTALPAVGHNIVTRLAIIWGRHKGITIGAMNLPSPRVFCAIAALYVLNYLVLGFVLHSISFHVFGADTLGILALTGIFAAAWITGFITPGAPAGLGVREVILISAMTPFYGQSIAVGVASILRIVTVLGDGMGFLMGLILRRMSRS